MNSERVRIVKGKTKDETRKKKKGVKRIAS